MLRKLDGTFFEFRHHNTAEGKYWNPALKEFEGTDWRNKIREIHIQDIDISEAEDGVYVGEYDAGYIYAKVEVTIENGNIAELRILEHGNERGEAAEVITEEIKRQQKLDVDAVTGATNSSSVIKKAVQNALVK